MTDFSTGVPGPIPYEGPDSDNPLAFRWYDADRVVAGRRMRDHLRFAVTCRNRRGAPIGPMAAARANLAATFEFLEKLTVPLWSFHDRDITPEGATFKETLFTLDTLAEAAVGHMTRTGIGLRWGAADLRSHPRYRAGGVTNPDPEVFAFAAAQVCHCLDVTHRLGGTNYLVRERRVTPSTRLDTDRRRELDQMGRFLHQVVEHKYRIGFEGTVLVDSGLIGTSSPHPDSDVAAVHDFLQRSGLVGEVDVNVEIGHVGRADLRVANEIALAATAGTFGGIDALAGIDPVGDDRGLVPASILPLTLALHEMLRAGGLGAGGTNLEAAWPEPSITTEDLLRAPIEAMDLLARSLLSAASLLDDGVIEGVRSERYRRWSGPLGQRILDGSESLASLHQWVGSRPEPDPPPGHEGRLEDHVALVIERTR